MIALGLPDPAISLLDRLITLKGETAEEIITRALILYDFAVQAEAEGNRMVVLDADDEIYQTIGGL